MIRSRALWTAILVLVSVTASFFISKGDLEGGINILFITGLVLLVAVGIHYVLSGDFFDLFSKGFRMLIPRQPKTEYGFEDPLDGSGREAEKERHTWIKGWAAPVGFWVGAIDAALSFLLLPFL